MEFIPSRTQFKTILLCLISGILAALSFPPFKTWVLIYPALLLILFLLTESANFKQALIRSYAIFLFFNLFSLYWISSWGSDDIFIKIGGIAVILIHPLFFLMPAVLYYLTYKNINLHTALILFPFYWTGFEYVHNLGQLAFPWIELGNTETYNINRVQYIEFTGVHGITFIICVTASLLFFIIFSLRTGSRSIRSPQIFISVAAVIAIIILPNIYSSTYLNRLAVERFTDYPENRSSIVKAAIVQTNIDAWKKWTSGIPELVDSYVRKLEKAAEQNPDLIVLHETTPPFYFFSEYYTDEINKFVNFINTKKQNLLMGVPYLHYYDDSASAPKDSKVMLKSGKRYDTFNSAILLEPNKKQDEYTIYSKVKLVPASERIPYQEYFPFLQKVFKWGVGLSSWQIGKDMTIFKLKVPPAKEIKFAVLICFESAFSEYVSEFTDRGAEFLVVITNDGWFGKSSGPYQHQQFSVLRAIENRKWIIRAAQTGISCFIDPLGNAYDKTELFTEAMITKDIIVNNEKTFYAANGDVIGKVSYWASIVMLIVNCVVFLNKRKEPAGKN